MTVAELESRVVTLEQKAEQLQDQLERSQLLAGIKRGLDEARRGLGKPLRQVDDELRAKYSIPRQ